MNKILSKIDALIDLCDDTLLAYAKRFLSIKSLQGKASKGAPAEIVNAQNIGLQGDIVADGGDLKKAAALYRKAVEASANSLTAPYYLKKLGQVEEALGNNAAALAAYQRIADEYNTALEARDIDAFIGRLK